MVRGSNAWSRVVPPRRRGCSGDVITSVNGASINSATAMADVLVPHHPGDNIALTYRSAGGNVRTVNVTLADGPPA